MTQLCGICKKPADVNSIVWYDRSMPEEWLCKKCYKNWNSFHKTFVIKHRKIKPSSKAWEKMCHQESREFMKWKKHMESKL